MINSYSIVTVRSELRSESQQIKIYNTIYTNTVATVALCTLECSANSVSIILWH